MEKKNIGKSKMERKSILPKTENLYSTQIINEKYNLEHITYLSTLNNKELFKYFKCNKDNTQDEKDKTNTRTLIEFVFENQVKEREITYQMGRDNRKWGKNSVATLQRDLRNFILPDCYDYDIYCCLPSLYRYICKIHNLPCAYVNKYIKKRGKYIKRDKKLSKLDWENAKTKINMAFSNPDCYTFEDEVLKGMMDEYRTNRSIIIEKEKDKINPNANINQGNPDFSKFRSIIMWYETFFVGRMVKRYKDDVICIVFDGFQTTKELDLEELNRLEEEEDTGLIWKLKPVETRFEIPEKFNLDGIKTYNQLKDEFKKTHTYITSLNSFITEDPTLNVVMDDATTNLERPRYVLYSIKTLTNKYKKYMFPSPDPNEDKEIPFIDRYMMDIEREDKVRTTFHPYSFEKDKIEHPDIFNEFEGFNSKNLKREIKDDEVKWFIEDYMQIFGECKDYIMKLLAFKFQKPFQRTNVICVLKGYEGCGKDSLLKVPEAIFGKEYVLNSAGMKEVFQAFNSSLKGKIFAVMNEVEGRDGINYLEQLKERCTAGEISIRQLYTEAYLLKHIIDYFILSNNNSPVQISPTDRRYVIIQLLEDFVGDVKFWNEFYENLENQDKLDELYTYFLNYKIPEDFNFQRDRPITEDFKDLCVKNIQEPHLVLWRELLPTTSQWKMKRSEFMRKCRWMSEVLEKHIIKKKVVKSCINKLPKNLIQIKKTNGEFWVIVENPEKLIERYKKLEFKNYDEDVLDYDYYDKDGKGNSSDEEKHQIP
jgi:hypothetical protein